jgi:tetratricopeptide (TPR) repeat protein
LQSLEVTEAQSSLLIRAQDAWRVARDAPHEGRAHADAIAAQARRSRDWPALVAALRARGWAERDVFALDAARRTLDSAVRLASRHRLHGLLAGVLATRASVRLETGDGARARRDIARARAVLDGASTAEIDLQAAVIEDVCGNLVHASDLYRLVIAASDSPGIETLWTAHNNLGVILGQLGQLGAAREHLAAATDIAGRLGRSTLGFSIHNTAMLDARAGQLAAALRRFDDAERIFREIGFPLAEHYMERIDVLVTLNLLADAEAIANRAIAELGAVGGALLRGEAHLARARVLMARGADDHAEQAAADAAALLTRARGPLWRAHADIVLVETRFRMGTADAGDLRRARRAAPALRDAGFSSESVDAHLLTARLLSRVGRVTAAQRELALVAAMGRSSVVLVRLKAHVARALSARLAGDESQTRRAARRGLTELEHLRVAIPTAELRARASVHGVELASLGLRSAIGSGRPSAVFDWMELGRQASTLISTRTTSDPEVDATMAQLREVIARSRLTEREPEDDPRYLLRTQSLLEARVQRRLRSLGTSPAEQSSHANAREIRDALGPRVLVELAGLDGRLVAVTLTRRDTRVHVLGPVDAAHHEMEALLFALRRIPRARSRASADAATNAARHALAELDALLVAPLRRRLAAGDEIVVVPTAALLAVPWHALPTLAARQVTVAPSATGWRRARDRRPDHTRVVVAAGPGLDGAGDEARGVGGIHPGATVLLPPASTVSRLVAALPGVGVAHLACHGDFRADNPAFSSLLLSDGPLTVVDLEQIETAPATVVLAACDAGMSQTLPGEEFLGFLSVLFALGSRSVVASSVPIPDVDSTPLMLALHRRLATGADAAKALHEARAEVGADTPQSLVASIAFGHFGG